MQKKNRIFMRVVAMLLCIVIITTCLVSSIFARYVARDSASVDGVKLKNWGITIQTGSHAANTYTDESGNTVVATKTSIGSANGANAIAPGMSGSLAWFHVFGSPDVDYNIDLNGRITIGTGYTNSVLTANEEPITYFPFVLYLVAYEVTYDGEEMVLTRTTDTNDYDKVMNFAQAHLRNEGEERNTLANTNAREDKTVACWTSTSNIQKTFNGENGYDYMSINNAFDQDNMSGPIDRVYALEWCWPYNHDASYPRSNEPNFKQGRYLYPEYDTQLGEKMRDNARSGDFDITLEMSVTVEQAEYVPPYTRNGDVITFGSYPQSQVVDNSLISTLNASAQEIRATYHSQNETSKKYSFYVDVKRGNDKYRGVGTLSSKPMDMANVSWDSLDGITWFKYEPIKWFILKEENGQALIISEKLLDKHTYQDEYSGDYITTEGVPENTYASSWEYSTIRTWLNGTFSNIAFNKFQQDILVEVTNKNDVSTTASSDYAKDADTQDKIFFLSYKEVTGASTNQYQDVLKKYFTSEDNNTQYSAILNNHTSSWTRSPAYQTKINGFSYWNGSRGRWDSLAARGANIVAGVRPAMWITL